jgi:type VI secretion system secreted protein Hcp
MKLAAFCLRGISADRNRAAKTTAVLGVALALSCAVPAHAATQLFLTWPGITGNSVAAGHVGDTDLLSYVQNASNTFSFGSGGGGAGKSICGQVTVTKHIDSTSPIFLGQVLSEKVTTGPVVITFAKTGEPQDTTFYTVKLHNVIPTSITQSDSQTDVLVETLVIMAQQFQFTFTPQLKDGRPGTPVTFSWDCRTGKAG